MIDPDKIADLAAAAERLLGFVDALAPPMDGVRFADLTPDARRRREPLVMAGVRLEEAARYLRAAAFVAPVRPAWDDVTTDEIDQADRERVAA